MNEAADDPGANTAAFLEAVQGYARTGLHYSRDVYDRQRYEMLAELAATYYGRLANLDAAQLRAGWAADVGAVTPKVGGTAAIFDDNGRVLLMKRTDNHLWCMPGGLSEPLEGPDMTAVREAKEETGLDVQIRELVGVFTRLPDPRYTPYTLVSVVYLCEITGGELQHSQEDEGLEWWRIEDVLAWHATQERYAEAARAVWKVLSK